MSDMASLAARLSAVNDEMAESARRLGIVAKHTDTLLLFMRRKVVIHEYVGFLSGMIWIGVLLTFHDSFWKGTAVAVLVIVCVDMIRDYIARFLARKMFTGDPPL